MKAAAGTGHPYVERRPNVQGGEPVIRGTRFPIRSVVVYVYRQGMTPEEMIREWKHLTLAQVYDALSYYFDHKAEIDRLIRESERSTPPRKMGT